LDNSRIKLSAAPIYGKRRCCQH